jgi:hypothetical protein
MMNSVHNLPTNLPTDLPTEFVLSVILLVKMTRHHFFLLCFNFFSHGNSLGIYRENISVGKIPRKFTDGNIPSVFPFVFINFLVVKRKKVVKAQIQAHLMQKKQIER